MSPPATRFAMRMHPIVLEAMDFPAPVISVAIEPKTKADQEKLGNALAKLTQEDPTFKVHTDPDTGQTLISGMGELHLEILVDRMVREFNVARQCGPPPGGLSRDHPGRRRRRKGSTCGRRAAAANMATFILRVEPLPASRPGSHRRADQEEIHQQV